MTPEEQIVDKILTPVNEQLELLDEGKQRKILSGWAALIADVTGNPVDGDDGFTVMAKLYNLIASATLQDGSVTQQKLHADLLAYLLSRANHTGTQAQSTITGLEAALAAKASQADVDAIKLLIGEEGGDVDAVVNTLREMLVVFQTYSEGVDIAQQIANAGGPTVETGVAFNPAALDFSTIKYCVPYTAPAGTTPLTIAGGQANNGIRVPVILDGTNKFSYPPGTILHGITSTETLPAGTYYFYFLYDGVNMAVSVPDVEVVASDTTNPTVTITSSESGTTSVNPIPITFTLSEAATDFTSADVVVGNGTLQNFTGSGTSYTAEVVPTADGAVTVDVAQGVFTDAAGNGNDAATQFSVTYSSADVTAPTIQSATVENAAPSSLVVVFDEVVNITDLTGLSLNFTTGTAKTLQSVSGSGTNTLTFTLSAAIESGDVFTLEVAAGNNIIDTASTPNALAATSQAVTNNVQAAGATVASVAGVKLKAHYKAEEANLTLSGSDVTQITDLSGNNHHLDTLHGGGPSFNSATPDGIVFDGTEGIYKAGHIISGGASRTLIAVIKPDVDADTIGIFAADGDGADSQGVFAVSVSTDASQAKDYSIRVNGGAQIFTGTKIAGEKHVVTLHMPDGNIANAQMRVNGTDLSVSSAGSATLNIQTGGYFALGIQKYSSATNSNSTSYTGNIYEVAYCDGLTAQQISDIENLLISEHGIV